MLGPTLGWIKVPKEELETLDETGLANKIMESEGDIKLPRLIMELDEPGKNLLNLLVSHLDNVVPGSPQTYIGYKRVHDILDLPQVRERWGESLKTQGLSSLANWTYENNLPGITGIIISLESYEPGKGYFNLFGKNEDDYAWWEGEIVKSKRFNWTPYIGNEFDLKPVDFDVPSRDDVRISRIIRDSNLSQKVKSINNYECQMCGLSIDMPEGKKYAEAHHIRPLGKPYNGPDIVENMICVCPNHHAMLDYGAIKLDLKSITLKIGHSISNEYIDYHNSEIYKL